MKINTTHAQNGLYHLSFLLLFLRSCGGIVAFGAGLTPHWSRRRVEALPDLGPSHLGASNLSLALWLQ